jgi:tRNA/tmRNA/rRNA uracil-C5-methylase (TrmA/RlmC/RlmD family)
MKSPSTRPFHEYLADALRGTSARTLQPGECQTARSRVCRLCHASRVSYEDELKAKQTALRRFWQETVQTPTLDPLVRSPEGRHYRSTTKRKAFRTRQGIQLGLISPEEDRSLRPISVVRCMIEPAPHGDIYKAAQDLLASKPAGEIAEVLRHIVVRGDAAEQTLIFTVERISGPVTRSANTLSRALTRRITTIVGVFLYEDTTRGTHYLGSSDPRRQVRSRKLFGKPEIFTRVLGRPFLYPPFSFSQVNPSLAGTMVDLTGELLDLNGRRSLIDLYCGYGLFGLSLAEKSRRVLGVELSPASVAAAARNAERQRITNARFLSRAITAESIGELLSRTNDAVLLDPPRNGTAKGVLEAIAACRPARVVHIFCNSDLIASELQRWRESGYRAVRAIPTDMFPGTSSLEVVISLQPE